MKYLPQMLNELMGLTVVGASKVTRRGGAWWLTSLKHGLLMMKDLAAVEATRVGREGVPDSSDSNWMDEL